MGLDQYFFALKDDPRESRHLIEVFSLNNHWSIHQFIINEFYTPMKIPQEQWSDQLVDITEMIVEMCDHHENDTWPEVEYAEIRIDERADDGIYFECLLSALKPFLKGGYLILYQCDF